MQVEEYIKRGVEKFLKEFFGPDNVRRIEVKEVRNVGLNEWLVTVDFDLETCGSQSAKLPVMIKNRSFRINMPSEYMDLRQNLPEFEQRTDILTVVELDIPYYLHINDDEYEFERQGVKYKVEIEKRKRNKSFFNGTAFIEYMYDDKGNIWYTHVKITYPGILREKCVKSYWLDEPPRSSIKQRTLEILNDFLEIYRYLTREFHIRRLRYQDVINWKLYRIVNSQKIPVREAIFDRGLKGVKIVIGQGDYTQNTNKLKNLLQWSKQIPPHEKLLLDAENALLNEEYRISVILSEMALENYVNNLLMEKLGIQKYRKIERDSIRKKLCKYLKDVLGYSLKDLSYDLWKVWDDEIRDIRNRVVHRGYETSSAEAVKALNIIKKIIEIIKSTETTKN